METPDYLYCTPTISSIPSTHTHRQPTITTVIITSCMAPKRPAQSCDLPPHWSIQDHSPPPHTKKAHKTGKREYTTPKRSCVLSIMAIQPCLGITKEKLFVGLGIKDKTGKNILKSGDPRRLNILQFGSIIGVKNY